MQEPSQIAVPDEWLRPEADVLQPRHLGAFQPSALSCTRYFIQALMQGGWSIEPGEFALDDVGAGIARYDIRVEGRHMEFVALANPPVEGGRGSRVLGGERDMNGGLHDGAASDEQIAVMRREMPKIYGGRAAEGTLVWCRSNRSTRLFDHVVERLAAGRQPDPLLLGEICYIMRNVGIEGNGIYGTAPFQSFGPDHPLRHPYMAQMLAAYMMREFSFDLVEHLARRRNPAAAKLAPEFRRFIGIGNGSAIGLVFFTYNRPAFVGRWLTLRERLLAHARRQWERAPAGKLALLREGLDRAIAFREEDRVVNREAAIESAEVAADLRLLRDRLGGAGGNGSGDPAALIAFAGSGVSREAFETLNSCLIETEASLVPALLDEFFAHEEHDVDPVMPARRLAEAIESDYRWALEIDFSDPASRHFVWYQSISNDEPRRGPNTEVDPGLNMLPNVPRQIQELHRDLVAAPAGLSVGRFLFAHPHHRGIVERVQSLLGSAYHTPIANPFSADFAALDLVRLIMVGYYGLEKSVDFFDRNSRGVMFHGAPCRHDIGGAIDRFWFYPRTPPADCAAGA